MGLNLFQNNMCFSLETHISSHALTLDIALVPKGWLIYSGDCDTTIFMLMCRANGMRQVFSFFTD